jgi:hypothetical protein
MAVEVATEVGAEVVEEVVEEVAEEVCKFYQFELKFTNDSGGNPHMGRCPEVQQSFRNQSFNFQSIMSKVDCTAGDADNRSSYPPRSEARLTTNFPTVTRVLSNHFAVNIHHIVPSIYQYHINIYRVERDGSVDASKDLSVNEDYRINHEIILLFWLSHPTWEGIGWTYDDRSTAFTSGDLQLPSSPGVDGGPEVKTLTELVCKKCPVTGFESTFQVKIMLASVLNTRVIDEATESVIRALNSVAMGFVRHGQYADPQKWFLVGSNAYRALDDSAVNIANTPYFIKRGYYAGLKACLAGLVLVSDMTVSCFLTGGPAMNVVATAGGFRDARDFERDMRNHSLDRRQKEEIEKTLKGAKMRTIHLMRPVKFKGLGPAANSRESEFMHKESNAKITVDDYYALMARTNPGYRDALGRDGRLRYPHLPCVNIGSKTKATYIPLELLEIVSGQSVKLNAYTEDMTTQTIRMAAALPNDRFEHIINGDREGRSLINVLATDMTAAQFGLNEIASQPMEVDAALLPSPVLVYGEQNKVDPKTDGRWFTPQSGYYRPASVNGEIIYGIMATIDGNKRNQDRAMDFQVRNNITFYSH